jgi:hypothetical protein
MIRVDKASVGKRARLESRGPWGRQDSVTMGFDGSVLRCRQAVILKIDLHDV